MEEILVRKLFEQTSAQQSHKGQPGYQIARPVGMGGDPSLRSTVGINNIRDTSTMIKQILKTGIFPIGLAMILNSCGLQKEVVYRLEKQPKEFVDLPLDYCNLFPDTSSFKNWDNSYNLYEKYLTQEILRTQMGSSSNINGVQIWWCMPSARTHIQLDTSTMISDNKSILGEWRMIANRGITYEDSVCYSENRIYRTSRLNFDNKEDDVYLLLTDDKFKLYAKTKGKDNYQLKGNRNYEIQSKRYLLLWGLSKASAAISFIGLDKEGRLIHNTYFVQERKIKGVYIVYQATMTQVIYKRLNTN